MSGPAYDAEYARTWIRHSQSGTDPFREEYLGPYFKERLATVSDILDVGCGWGAVLDYLKHDVSYTGVDRVSEFLDFIKQKYGSKFQNMTLYCAKLPDLRIHRRYSVVLCSMVLHMAPDLRRCIDILYTALNDGGRLILVTFADKGYEFIHGAFVRVDTADAGHISGSYELPSGILVETEIYFHRESNYEKLLGRYGTVSKRYIGPLFVAYEITK